MSAARQLGPGVGAPPRPARRGPPAPPRRPAAASAAAQPGSSAAEPTIRARQRRSRSRASAATSTSWRLRGISEPMLRISGGSPPPAARGRRLGARRRHGDPRRRHAEARGQPPRRRRAGADHRPRVPPAPPLGGQQPRAARPASSPLSSPSGWCTSATSRSRPASAAASVRQRAEGQPVDQHQRARPAAPPAPPPARRAPRRPGTGQAPGSGRWRTSQPRARQLGDQPPVVAVAAGRACRAARDREVTTPHLEVRLVPGRARRGSRAASPAAAAAARRRRAAPARAAAASASKTWRQRNSVVVKRPGELRHLVEVAVAQRRQRRRQRLGREADVHHQPVRVEILGEERGVHHEGRAVQPLRRPEDLGAGRLWAIMMWSRTSTANMALSFTRSRRDGRACPAGRGSRA